MNGTEKSSGIDFEFGISYKSKRTRATYIEETAVGSEKSGFLVCRKSGRRGSLLITTNDRKQGDGVAEIRKEEENEGDRV